MGLWGRGCCPCTLLTFPEQHLLPCDAGCVQAGALGTASYMAPEAMAAGQISERCDGFSYAVLVWEVRWAKGDAPPFLSVPCCKRHIMPAPTSCPALPSSPATPVSPVTLPPGPWLQMLTGRVAWEEMTSPMQIMYAVGVERRVS